MKQAQKIISILLLISLFSTALTACIFKSDQQLIEDRMDVFLKAYNSGNFEAVLECLDAKSRNTYKSAFGIGSGLIGLTGFSVNMSDLFGLSIGLIPDGDALRLENTRIAIKSSTTAVVYATMYYHDLETDYSEDVQIKLVKEDGDWFICG